MFSLIRPTLQRVVSRRGLASLAELEQAQKKAVEASNHLDHLIVIEKHKLTQAYFPLVYRLLMPTLTRRRMLSSKIPPHILCLCACRLQCALQLEVNKSSFLFHTQNHTVILTTRFVNCLQLVSSA